MANWIGAIHWNVGEGLIDFTSRCLLCENSAPIIYKCLCLSSPMSKAEGCVALVFLHTLWKLAWHATYNIASNL